MITDMGVFFMKKILDNYYKVNKFSKTVVKSFLIIAAAICLCGTLLFKISTTYYKIFLSKKIIETGFCFVMLAFALGFLTDYLYKKEL